MLIDTPIAWFSMVKVHPFIRADLSSQGESQPFTDQLTFILSWLKTFGRWSTMLQCHRG
jgi:hypothetical protein